MQMIYNFSLVVMIKMMMADLDTQSFVIVFSLMILSMLVF